MGDSTHWAIQKKLDWLFLPSKFSEHVVYLFFLKENNVLFTNLISITRHIIGKLSKVFFI
jgi:hypothetical protein